MACMDRREWLGGAALSGLALLGGEARGTPAGAAMAVDPPRRSGGAATSERLRIDDPDAALRLWARLNGDLAGGPMFAFLGGVVYGFRPQADDVTLEEFARRLYGYRSCVLRSLRFEKDRLVVRSRSWNWYTDVESGRFIRELRNPYTGELVQCPPRMGPPGEQAYTREGPRLEGAPFPVESSEAGRPFRLESMVLGDSVWLRRAAFTRFRPPDIDWWKLEADVLTHSARLADVLDERLGHVPNALSHNLVAEWQTWMKMHGSPGHILFVGNGAHVRDAAALPAELRATIEELYPGTLGAGLYK